MGYFALYRVSRKKSKVKNEKAKLWQPVVIYRGWLAYVVGKNLLDFLWPGW